MPDRRRILRQWHEGAAGVLVTLLRAQGSSYRRPGAHLLIGPNGESSGSISGGCLEAEIVRKAAWMARDGAIVERYSTLFDDTAEIPYGLGCGGIVDLLLEPVNPPECRALLEAMEASLTGAASRIATWLPHPGHPPRRVVFAPGGSTIFASESLRKNEIADAHAIIVNSPNISGILPIEQAAQPIYVEHFVPPQRLIVLGAGEDAKPVVTLAALLGWRVLVAEGRAQLAQAARFPEADRVLATASLADLSLRASDAVILMTHSYEQDRAILAQLLAPLRDQESAQTATSEIPNYIGLLGASHRSALLLSEAAASLRLSLEQCCRHIHAPVGLDLGGDGAEAIALAIIAEVQAHIQGRLASSRHLTPARIAEHLAHSGSSSRYVQSQCARDPVAK